MQSLWKEHKKNLIKIALVLFLFSSAAPIFLRYYGESLTGFAIRPQLGTITLANTGTADPSVYSTSSLDKSAYYFNCADTDGGCRFQITETGAKEGQFMLVSNVTAAARSITVNDEDGLIELSGDANKTITQDDTLFIVYVSGAWRQLSAIVDN